MQDDLNGHCNVKSEAQGEDIEMEDAKSSRGASEEAGDEDGVDSKGKKKKGLRFYCSDYPPCNLSFTRSEHLARHIRLVNGVIVTNQSAHAPLASTLANGRSNATVTDGFLGWII